MMFSNWGSKILYVFFTGLWLTAMPFIPLTSSDNLLIANLSKGFFIAITASVTTLFVVFLVRRRSHK